MDAKRILLFLALLALPGLAAAANTCHPDPAVCVPGPCLWSSAASWTDCGGTIPQAGDTVSTNNGTDGDVITFDVSSASLDALYIWFNDTVQCTGSTGRTLNLATSGAIITNYGTFKICNGLTIDATASSGTPYFANVGVFSSENVDLGDLHKVTAFAASTTSGNCISGDAWTVTTADDLTGLVQGDIVQFESGAAAGRMFEVKSPGPPLLLCRAMPDWMSQGPRLTPHITRSSVDIVGAPIPVQLPAVGDTFLAWKPWVMTSDTVKWLFGDGDGQANLLTMVGGEIRNHRTESGAGMVFQSGATRPPIILAHLNFHDNDDGIIIRGGSTTTDGSSKPAVLDSVFHDNPIPDSHYQVGFERNSAGGSPTVGGVLAGNTFYRTTHNNINVNNAGSTQPISGTEVADNTLFELASGNSGEQEGIELDAADHLVVQRNACWNTGKIDCIVAKPGAAFATNLIRYNWLSGANVGIELGPSGNLYGPNVVCYGNYSSHSFRQGIKCWESDYNVVRRWSEGNSADGAFTNLDGIEAHRAEGNALDGAGSVRANWGILDFADSSDSSLARTFRNNYCKGLVYVGGGGLAASCIYLPLGAEQVNVSIRHNVGDCGAEATCRAVAFIDSWDPSTSQTLDVMDNIALGTSSSAQAVRDIAGTHVTDTLTNLTRFGGIGAAFGTWSAQAGEVERDPLFVSSGSDMNLLSTSREFGAGSTPAGSTIGLRAVRFPLEHFAAYLQGIMAIPAPVMNEPASDIDLDGWPAFALGDSDSPDKCPWIPDFLNAQDNGGTTCKNLAAGAGKALNKGAN